ncbi:MAG: hypothetical protein ACKO9R_03895 [Dolichospermum sp.]
MDPITVVAGIVTIILTGALTRVGELSLDGAILNLKKLIEARSPQIINQLQATGGNQAPSPETIDAVATLIKNDPDIQQLAEQVATENKSNPYILSYMRDVGMVVHGGTVQNPVFNFNN